MRNLFNLVTIFSLLGLVLCQTYIDVHVCNGFDNSSPIQTTITTSSGSWVKNITFAQCVDFPGVTTSTGSMAATFMSVLYTPTGPSSTLQSTTNNQLIPNSGQNVFVIWDMAGTGTALTFTQLFSTQDTRATGNQALYVGGDFTHDLDQVNVTVPGLGSAGPFTFGQHSTFVGPTITNQDPHATVTGFFTNSTSGEEIQKILNFPVGTGPVVTINTWPGSTFYALLCGSIGADLSGAGYRIMGGPNGVNSYGITFNNTGSAPPQFSSSSTGPAGNFSSSTGTNNGVQGAVDILSPLTFILAALFALFATQL